MELPRHIINKIMLYNSHPVADLIESEDFVYSRGKVMFRVLQRNRKHGSAFDRGSADAYYYRMLGPHKWIIQEGQRPVEDYNLSDEEEDEYWIGYHFETNRK